MSNKQTKDDIKPAKTLDKAHLQAYERLTRKERLFINDLLNDPSQSATSVIERHYNTTSKSSATSLAHNKMTKDDIQIILKDYGTEAIHTIHDVMTTGSESNRLSAAKDLADRTFGKATQRTESVSLTIEAVVDDLHA